MKSNKVKQALLCLTYLTTASLVLINKETDKTYFITKSQDEKLESKYAVCIFYTELSGTTVPYSLITSDLEEVISFIKKENKGYKNLSIFPNYLWLR